MLRSHSIISVQVESGLHFSLSNATTEWDTPTFLTLAPEPESDALASVAITVVAAVRARRRSS